MSKDVPQKESARDFLRNRFSDGNGAWSYQPIPAVAERRAEETWSAPSVYSEEDARTPFVCGVGFEIRCITDVDCVAQRFLCVFCVFLKWFDKKHLAPQFAKAGLVDLDEGMAPPQVLVLNALDSTERDTTVFRLDEDPPGVLMCETMYTATLSEFMELELFPVDVQDLTISLRFRDPRWTIRSLPEPRYQAICDSVELAEWYLFEPLVESGVEKGIGRGIWRVKLKVLRKSEFYMSNVVFMVGAFASLTFLAYLFPPQKWDMRSTYTATLLLTSVAFKFVLAGSLPKVSFMTVLDVYLTVAFFIMFLVVIQSAVVYFVHLLDVVAPEDLLHIDLCVALLLAVAWAACNLLYMLRFHQLEVKQRSRSDLGNVLPHVNSNKPSQGAMTHIVTGEIEEGQDENESDMEGASNGFPSDRL
eukprot:TRINITY_DN23633_c0_g2_i1.p1 TRINITY_DN23633_c0_g2~~TRINITY_DN23633_c0_g2_i1.p1  ORF type:complete len:417 (+),score=72.85 TRINITY_DN23633_c0_g2_i1:144-1394(+)